MCSTAILTDGVFCTTCDPELLNHSHFHCSVTPRHYALEIPDWSLKHESHTMREVQMMVRSRGGLLAPITQVCLAAILLGGELSSLIEMGRPSFFLILFETHIVTSVIAAHIPRDQHTAQCLSILKRLRTYGRWWGN